MVRQADGHLRFKPLFQFCSACGLSNFPNGALIIDTQGNSYGITSFNLNPGVVSKLSPSGDRWVETILHKFCSGCPDGNGPLGGLIYAGQSNGVPYDGLSPLFGITKSGGANNGGTVFELTNSNGNWTETLLYNFCSQGIDACRDGTSPARKLIMDPSGNLFGTTLRGGNKMQAGTAFELSPSGDTWQYTRLYTFCSEDNCADGANPSGPLLFDQDNNLLGTTYGGGACRAHRFCGTIFEITEWVWIPRRPSFTPFANSATAGMDRGRSAASLAMRRIICLE